MNIDMLMTLVTGILSDIHMHSFMLCVSNAPCTRVLIERDLSLYETAFDATLVVIFDNAPV